MRSRTASVLLTALIAATSLAALRAADDESTPIDTFPNRGARATLSARIPRVPVVLDTSAYVGEHARIFLRFADLTPGGQAIAGVQWRAHGLASGSLRTSGDRLLVFDGVISESSFEDVFDFQVLTTQRALNGTTVLHPVFEVERIGPGGRVSIDPLAAHTERGERLLVPVPVWRLSADSAVAADTSSADQPGGVVISPTARGVRLERGVRGMRISLLPEATENHGLSMGGAFASTLFGGAAAIMGSTSEKRDEVMLNSAWPLGLGRLLVTVGQQRESLAFGFQSGMVQRRMTQRGGGIGYEGQLTAAWATRLTVQGYTYGTPGREAGSYAYMVDTDSTREFYTTSERVAGSRLFGLQSRGSFAPSDGTRITLGVGAERLGFDYHAGRETDTTVTGSAALAQQLPAQLSLQVSEDRYAAHSLRRIAIGRHFSGNQHYIDASLQAIDGRKGMPNDLRFRVGYAFSIGNFGSPSRSARRGEFSAADALLAQVSSRPSFMPFTPIARVDHTVAAQRVVVVHKDALPAATLIDAVDGTVMVPMTVEGIASITRNGVSFVNAGQFSYSPDGLLVHPMHMEHPADGATDWYVVVLHNGFGTLTDVTIEARKGSLRLVSVTVGEPREEDTPADDAPEPDIEDTTPDAFSFLPRKDVELNTLVTSDGITVAGINAATAIGITGGEYSINGGTYTSAPGMVSNGQVVSVRQTSSASFSTTTEATLTIGGVSGSFSVTTMDEPKDTTPDAFSFPAANDIEVETLVTSSSITVAGINTATAIVISGGEYSIDGGAYTSAPGTVSNGQVVNVRQTSSASFSTTTVATLTIGGVSAGFSVTTEAIDTTPDAFAFPTIYNVKENSTQTSAPITVAGINAPATITVSGHSSSRYSINGGSFTATPGTVTNGDVVRVRHTASGSDGGSRTTTLTIGGVSGTFRTITEDD